MSIIKCDECGREISSKSLFCPGCGYPTHLNSAHPDGHEPEALAAIRKAIENDQPEPAAQPQDETDTTVDTHQEAEESKVSATADECGLVPETEPEENPEEDPEDYKESHRKNERNKVWLFLSVFILLLGVVLYFYFTSPVDKVEEESVDEEMIDQYESDSLSVAASTDPDTTMHNTADTVANRATSKPAARPAVQTATTTPSQAEERVITVAPLSRQAAHSSDTTEKTTTQ